MNVSFICSDARHPVNPYIGRWVNDNKDEYAIELIDFVEPEPQSEAEGATYYARRTPQDCMIDPSKSITEQFDLIRVCDPYRFPAFFEHLGHRYILKLEKHD